MNKPSPTALRRAFIVALVLAAAATTASEWPEAEPVVWNLHGYQWVPDETLPRCGALTWVQKPRELMQGLCDRADVYACSIGCVTFSPYSETEAKRFRLYGESLFSHERRHVLGRMSHPPQLLAEAK